MHEVAPKGPPMISYQQAWEVFFAVVRDCSFIQDNLTVQQSLSLMFSLNEH